MSRLFAATPEAPAFEQTAAARTPQRDPDPAVPGRAYERKGRGPVGTAGAATLSIRPADPDDRAAVASLIADAFEGREAIIGQRPPPLSLDVADAIATRLVFIASFGAAAPCGVLVAQHDPTGVFDVEVVAVRRDHAGFGIGQALMHHAERQARRAGARTMVLYTTARVERNLEFYRRLGFHEARRSGMSAFERVHFEKPLIGRAQKAPVDGLYGRRRTHGHKVDPAYARLAMDMERPADAAALFGGRPLRLEVGFGGGEHLLHHARLEPEVGLIGVEPFETGMMRTAAAIEAEGLANVRLYMGDARRVLDWLPEGALERADVLYPDPWHKQRHWKRRFISADGLDRLARAVRPGGEVRFASDIVSYVDWTRAHVAAHPSFAVADDRADPWPHWPGTRYEAKAIREGGTPRYITLRRL